MGNPSKAKKILRIIFVLAAVFSHQNKALSLDIK